MEDESGIDLCFLFLISNGDSGLSVVFPRTANSTSACRMATQASRSHTGYVCGMVLNNYKAKLLVPEQKVTNQTNEDDIFSNKGRQRIQCYLLMLKRQMSTRKTRGRLLASKKNGHFFKLKGVTKTCIWSQLVYNH